jgi:8-oxo-dGTP pyrophosphatase MutT (NUDIX family)
MEHNPWKTLSTREVYHNPWIRVREDQVTRPDGKPGIYGVVETRIATGVVPITADQHTYLVGQYRYPVNQYSWEIPEGGTEVGEDPLDAIKRELLEEAGLVAASWEPLGEEIHLSNCWSAEKARMYVARDLTEGKSAPEGTELLQVKKVPLKKAIAMVDSGEIKDTISIVALLRVARQLHL